jgi:hypothetical protein
MLRDSAERVAMIALLVAMVVALPTSQLRAAPAHMSLWPRCLEPRIAAGDVYPSDRGLALAVARGVAAHDPALAQLVNAVAYHDAMHPVTSEAAFDPDERPAGIPLEFVVIVVTLAERPDLARPDLMHQLVRIGRGVGYSEPHAGMAGIVEYVVRTGGASDGPGLNWDLFSLVRPKVRYVSKSGIVGSDDWRNGSGSAQGVFGCDDERVAR